WEGPMKRVESRKTEDTTTKTGAGRPSPNSSDSAASNGGVNGHRAAELSEAHMGAILTGLQTMRDGDFSFRLPGTWNGVGGKIADCFNEIIVANERMAQELKRVGHVVGKEGKTKERTRFYDPRGAWGEMEVSVNTLVDDLLRPTTEVT